MRLTKLVNLTYYINNGLNSINNLLLIKRAFIHTFSYSLKLFG